MGLIVQGGAVLGDMIVRVVIDGVSIWIRFFDLEEKRGNLW